MIMSIKKFLFDILTLLIILLVVNFPLNEGYEYLKKNGHIQQKSGDGFTTWEIVFEKKPEVVKERAALTYFPAERGSLEEIRQYKNTVVFLGSSVVAGNGIENHKTFTAQMKKKYAETYFWNGGIDGAELYSEVENIEKLTNDLKNIVCIVWFPNRNDFISNKDFQSKKEQVKEAKALSKIEEQTWYDKYFLGFFKRLAQKITFEGNIRKEKALDGAHNLYYTKGLTSALTSEVSIDLNNAIQSLSRTSRLKNIKLIAVFLPSRHFNYYHTWDQAVAFHQVSDMLNKENIKSYELFTSLKGKDEYVDYIHFNSAAHAFIATKLQPIVDEGCNL